MSENKSNEFLALMERVLQDYETLCKVAPFDGDIILAENMGTSYSELRKDLVDNGTTNPSNLQDYNGLTVQPKAENGFFTILLNRNYILKCFQNNNVDWIGTLVHEAVHVNDFKDYFNLIKPESYDELYEYEKHRIFLYWTEFHARAIGHYFLRKYTLEDFKDDKHLNHLINIELPFQVNYMVQEVSATNDMDRQMYVIVHFLGRLAIWQYLYPTIFDDEFIGELTNQNPWMKDLLNLFLKCDTIEKAYSHFKEIEELLEKNLQN